MEERFKDADPDPTDERKNITAGEKVNLEQLVIYQLNSARLNLRGALAEHPRIGFALKLMSVWGNRQNLSIGWGGEGKE